MEFDQLIKACIAGLPADYNDRRAVLRALMALLPEDHEKRFWLRTALWHLEQHDEQLQLFKQ